MREKFLGMRFWSIVSGQWSVVSWGGRETRDRGQGRSREVLLRGAQGRNDWLRGFGLAEVVGGVWVGVRVRGLEGVKKCLGTCAQGLAGAGCGLGRSAQSRVPSPQSLSLPTSPQPLSRRGRGEGERGGDGTRGVPAAFPKKWAAGEMNLCRRPGLMRGREAERRGGRSLQGDWRPVGLRGLH